MVRERGNRPRVWGARERVRKRERASKSERMRERVTRVGLASCQSRGCLEEQKDDKQSRANSGATTFRDDLLAQTRLVRVALGDTSEARAFRARCLPALSALPRQSEKAVSCALIGCSDPQPTAERRQPAKQLKSRESHRAIRKGAQPKQSGAPHCSRFPAGCAQRHQSRAPAAKQCTATSFSCSISSVEYTLALLIRRSLATAMTDHAKT